MAAVSTTIARALPLEDAMQVIYNGGFTRIELAYSHLEKPIDIIKAARLADQLGMEITSVHLPFERLDISHSDEGVRRGIIGILAQYLKYCSQNDLRLIIIHPNHYTDADDMEWYERDSPMCSSLYDLGYLAQSLDLRIAIENQPEVEDVRVGTHMVDFAPFIRHFGEEYIGICLDVVTASGNFEADPAEEIQKAGSQLFAVHLADNNPYNPTHAMPKSGFLDWDSIMAALEKVGYEGYYTFEVYGPSSIKGMTRDEALAEHEKLVRRLSAVWRRLSPNLRLV